MPRNTRGRLKEKAIHRNRIREWRKFRRLPQEELADRAGTTTATISRLERGKQPYNQRLLEAIAPVLQCRPADLIARGPLDGEDLLALWELLSSSQRKQAMRVLKALVEEAEDAA